MSEKIIIIGLGYVGLPLAVAFSQAKKEGKNIYEVIGFDISNQRIQELKNNIDITNEVLDTTLLSQKNLKFTCQEQDIKNAHYYIVTVPTPVDTYNHPDLTPIKMASTLIGRVLKNQYDINPIIIFESTVYPGLTENICAPIIEEISEKKFNEDFFLAYSPERINPGDRVHTLENIVKIVSGSSPEVLNKVDSLYKNIIQAGTVRMSSIKTAEAVKVLENSQRDLNIAFMNEMAHICSRLNISVYEVLKGMNSKWNALGFQPGLVGGHCIGVDPYYIAQSANTAGYYPELILSSRRINDKASVEFADKMVREIFKVALSNDKSILSKNHKKALILGATFKEDIPDIRNTKVIDFYHRLTEYNLQIDIFDPNADPKDFEKKYKIPLLNKISQDEIKNTYNIIILCVAHTQFLSLPFSDWKKEGIFIFDIKGKLKDNERNLTL